MIVTKFTKIGELLDADGDVAPFFLDMGMHCLGCPTARNETLEQACMVHGVETDKLVRELNDFFNNKK